MDALSGLESPEARAQRFSSQTFPDCAPTALGIARASSNYFRNVISPDPALREPVARLLEQTPTLPVELGLLFAWLCVQSLASPMREAVTKALPAKYANEATDRFTRAAPDCLRDYQETLGGDVAATDSIRKCVGVVHEILLERRGRAGRHGFLGHHVADPLMDRAEENVPRLLLAQTLSPVEIRLRSRLGLDEPTPESKPPQLWSDLIVSNLVGALVSMTTWSAAQFLFNDLKVLVRMA
jgi:hypothetical protein